MQTKANRASSGFRPLSCFDDAFAPQTMVSPSYPDQRLLHAPELRSSSPTSKTRNAQVLQLMSCWSSPTCALDVMSFVLLQLVEPQPLHTQRGQIRGTPAPRSKVIVEWSRCFAAYAWRAPPDSSYIERCDLSEVRSLGELSDTDGGGSGAAAGSRRARAGTQTPGLG